MYTIITIGDPVIDTHVQLPDKSEQCALTDGDTKMLSFEYGAKIPIVDSFQSLGGNAANVAVAGAKLGLEAGMLTTIGDDSNGRLILEMLKRYKVNTDLITTEHDTDTRYSIVLNFRGERTILSYSDKKTYIWPNPVPAAEWIYYSGLSAGYEVVHENVLAYLDSHATTRLAVNPGSYMLKYAMPALKEAIAEADLLIVNLEEAEAIAGTTRQKAKGEVGLMHTLMEIGAAEVVLTDGMRGAWAGTKEEIWHTEPYPVKVVAKTGAGDSFSAGYLAARHAGHDMAHALEWGTANSASVVGAHGPHAGLLDEKGVKKMIEKFSEVKPEMLQE